jgi:signal peptidase II
MTPRNRGLALAAFIYIADQLVKWYVIGPLNLPGRGEISILPIFKFIWVKNPGVAMGMLTADTPFKVLLLTVFTGAIAVFVGLWLWREKNRYDGLALGAILGGALGNITDRIRFGHVSDFMNLHFGEFSPFLVFNVADAAITVGVLILLARALFTKDGAGESVVEKQDA